MLYYLILTDSSTIRIKFDLEKMKNGPKQYLGKADPYPSANALLTFVRSSTCFLLTLKKYEVYTDQNKIRG